MRIFSDNGLALHWREDGDPEGAALVFANSLGTDLRLWDAVLPLLPGGLRIIRFDFPGHGLSDRMDGYQMDTLADHIAGFLDAIDASDTCFVGCSMGGMIGMNLAWKRPDLIRALVLSNSAPRMGTADKWQARMDAIRADGMDSVADAVMAAWFSPAFHQDPHFALWRNMFTRTDPAGYLAACGAIRDADLSDRIGQISVPTLVVGGSMDGSSPPEQVRAAAAAISGARYHEIQGAGHLPAIEAPAEFARELTLFLKETNHV